MQPIFIFDVDGVLCDSNQPIDYNFKTFFLEWAKNKIYYLITGSDLEKTIEQIGIEIVKGAEMVFNCMGNSIYINGKQMLYNQFQLKDVEIEFLENEIANSKFDYKTGNHIVHRQGSVNFSVPGRNATLQQRALYKTYDSTINERQQILERFITKFPRFEAYIGGDISIDICLRGANKGGVYEFIPNIRSSTVYFFADKAYPGGIDEPFANKILQNNNTVFHVKGFKSTKKIIKKL